MWSQPVCAEFHTRRKRERRSETKGSGEGLAKRWVRSATQPWCQRAENCSQQKSWVRGWGCNSAVECMLSMREALSSIPSTLKSWGSSKAKPLSHPALASLPVFRAPACQETHRILTTERMRHDLNVQRASYVCPQQNPTVQRGVGWKYMDDILSMKEECYKTT